MNPTAVILLFLVLAVGVFFAAYAVTYAVLTPIVKFILAPLENEND